MDNEPAKKGRPKTHANIRTVRVSGYLTESDSEQIKDVAKACGFTSTSELITAILERLCIGGFSGIVFMKLGFQFANVLSDRKAQRGFYFGVRPLPPLIGDQPVETPPENLLPFVRDIENEIKINKEKL